MVNPRSRFPVPSNSLCNLASNFSSAEATPKGGGGEALPPPAPSPLSDNKYPAGSSSPGGEEPKSGEKTAPASSSSEKPVYPPLPEEPQGKREVLCRVGIRLPDGRRIQRNFLLTDPIQVEIVDPSLRLIARPETLISL